MSVRPRIIFVNRFYWPDEPATAQLLTDLAEALAARGHAVAVIASRPRNSSIAKTERHNGVEIIRVTGPRLGRRNAFLKALDFLSFSLGALRQISRHLQAENVLVVMTDPPLLGIPATRLARRRGAHVVHWIQDVYPEIVTAVGGPRLARIFRGARDRAWKDAAACAVLSGDMAAFARSRGVDPKRVVTIPNWAPTGLAPGAEPISSDLRDRWSLTGKFVIGYSGNLGRVHDLDSLLDVAVALRAENDIAFVFIGDGPQKARLQARVASQQLTHVSFQPAQPRSQLGETLTLPDLHVVTLRAGCEQLVFPSKVYGIAAVGRPVLFIGPPKSEIATLVQSEGFGLAVSREEPAAAATIIRSLKDNPAHQATLRQAAVRFWENKGRLEHALSAWSEIVQKPLAKSEPATRVCTP
jgi:glycosyltransferase involved in cell wall biosynthesis